MRTRVHGCELQPPRYFADSTKVPHTLLLADDSVTIQRVIELTFADEDVRVVAVSDGDQAIERLEEAPPDIVLADIGMPGKNGYEVALHMRRSPKLAHIPVLLLTGAFEPVDQARANDAGCDGVLAKPFEPQLVIGRVKELLARAHRAPGASGGPAAAAPRAANQPPFIPSVDPPAAKAPGDPAASTELNDYFDRLDAAFSSLTSAPAPNPAPAPAVADPPTGIDNATDWFTTPPSAAGSAGPWDAPTARPVDGPADLARPQAAPEPQIVFLDEAMSEPPVEIPGDRLSAIEESVPVESAGGSRDAATAAAAPVHERVMPFARPSTSAPVQHAPSPGAAAALELPLPNRPALPSLPDAFAALLAAEQGEPASAASGLWPAETAPAPTPPVVTDEMIEAIVRRVLDRLSDTVVRDAVADVASSVAERLVLEEIARIRAAIK